MDKESNIVFIIAGIENIALILLAGFLCWYFKNGWGVLVLFFSNSFRGMMKQKEPEPPKED